MQMAALFLPYIMHSNCARLFSCIAIDFKIWKQGQGITLISLV